MKEMLILAVVLGILALVGWTVAMVELAVILWGFSWFMSGAWFRWKHRKEHLVTEVIDS